ncbi:helix-turn-helix transcriptional regulator [Shimia sp. W99]
MADTYSASNTKVLRLPQVIEMTGVARSTIYLWIKQGNFPRPLKLSTRRVGWLASDIEEWIHSRPESCGNSWPHDNENHAPCKGDKK